MIVRQKYKFCNKYLTHCRPGVHSDGIRGIDFSDLDF